MHGPHTRPSLLQRVKDSSDDDAWRAFDARYRDFILAYCRRRGLQDVDAEEVHQLVLIRLSRFLPKFEYDARKGRFRRYLGRVVRGLIARYCEGKMREQRLDTDDAAQLAATAADAEAIWMEEWTRHHYRLAFDSVRSRHSPRSVEIFERLLAGRSPAQVAAEFDTTAQAVHKIKQRMRDQLHACIADQVAEEDGAGV